MEREPEASYEQYTSRWEDMGNPAYIHPNQRAPGHIVCLTWDSAIAKFGVDRGAGVWNDYGNPDRFQFWFDFGDAAKGIAGAWRGQRLADGLPVITTTLERDGVRYEVEQFAYPLNGPPQERRGDIPMVLLQKVRLSELQGTERTVPVTISQRRQFPAYADSHVLTLRRGNALLFEDSGKRRAMFAIEGASEDVAWEGVGDYQREMQRVNATVFVPLPAHGTRGFTVKLASPPVAPQDAGTRAETLKFWSGWIERGAGVSCLCAIDCVRTRSSFRPELSLTPSTRPWCSKPAPVARHYRRTKVGLSVRAPITMD